METGINFFDKYIGGIEDSTMTLIYGSYGVGKTNFCLITLVNYLIKNKNKKVVFIDTDSSFSIERVKQIVENKEEIFKDVIKRVFIFSPTDFNSQRKIVMNLSGTLDDLKDVGLIIVDSLTMLYRFEFNRENSEINLMVAKLIEIARKRDLSLIVTSQTYIDFDNQNLRIVGGEVMLYAAKSLIHFEKEKEGNNKLTIIKARNVKEKTFNFKITNTGFDLI